jgi:hypothetical protein
LDRVVGQTRCPTFDDKLGLVYVKAFVIEVLRWRSVAVLGGQPHAPIQDETYKVKTEITIERLRTNIIHRAG